MREHQANRWAADFLIPPEHAPDLPQLKTEAAVRAFSHRLSVHPGIVVGRLQHEGLIPPAWMNGLKVSFRWASPKPEAEGAPHERN